MPLHNFSLLASVWGPAAVIDCVEIQEIKIGSRKRWQAMIMSQNGQMLFSNINGQPRSWTSIDNAIGELNECVPTTAVIKIVRVVPDVMAHTS